MKKEELERCLLRHKAFNRAELSARLRSIEGDGLNHYLTSESLNIRVRLVTAVKPDSFTAFEVYGTRTYFNVDPVMQRVGEMIAKASEIEFGMDLRERLFTWV